MLPETEATAPEEGHTEPETAQTETTGPEESAEKEEPERVRRKKEPHSTHAQKRRQAKGLLSKRGVAENFDICPRTVDRWKALGILRPGKRIRGREYWDDDVEPLSDAARAITAS
jgi:hypothetical protein